MSDTEFQNLMKKQFNL